MNNPQNTTDHEASRERLQKSPVLSQVRTGSGIEIPELELSGTRKGAAAERVINLPNNYFSCLSTVAIVLGSLAGLWIEQVSGW